MAKILITEKVDSCGPELLTSKGHEVVYLKTRDQQELAQAIKDCDAVLVRVMEITREIIESAPRLKIISKHGVGVDNIDMEAARERGITVTIVPDGNALSVAEHTIALILALAKKIPSMAAGYKAKGYDVKSSQTCTEISGKTLGLVGMGRIGALVAKMAHFGFDMRVIAFDPYLKNPPEWVEMAADRDAVLRQADFISLHSPLLPETRHSIGKREFELMKHTASIVNCARGPIIDEQALIEALQAGVIGGAALDVSDPEPAEPDNPLFSMPNAIMTPHNAAGSIESLQRVSQGAAKNIDDLFSGRELTGRVI